jgi:hypothetical protein
MRTPHDLDRDDEYALVEYAIVIDVLAQRERRRLCARVKEDRRPGRAVDRRVHRSDLLDEVGELPLLLSAARCEKRLSFPPGGEQREEDGGNREREPAAFDDLGNVRREEREVDDEEGEASRRDDPDRASPEGPDNDKEQDRRDDHRPGHRYAIRACERRRSPEAEDEASHAPNRRVLTPLL